MAVSLIANFALCSAEKDEQYFEESHVMDYFAVIAIFILLIGFGLLVWLKGPHVHESIYGESKAFKLDCKGNLQSGDSFHPLDKPIQSIPILPEGCYKLGSRPFPHFAFTEDIKFARPGFAAGLLLPNGRFNLGSIDDSSIICPHNLRQHFFPGDMNAGSDFLCLAGTAEQMKHAFANLIVCQSNLQESHGLFLNAVPTDLGKTSASGLNFGQTSVYRNPVPGGISSDLSSYVPMKEKCENSCKFVIVAPQKDYLNIRGKLLVKDFEGKISPYGVPEADIAMALYHKDTGKLKFIGFGSYDAQGNFLIQAPFFPNSGYSAVLTIVDNSGSYLPNSIDLFVNPGASAKDMNIGSIFLLTASGQGCKQTDFAKQKECFGQQASSKRNLKLHFENIIKSKAINFPFELTIRSTSSSTGSIVFQDNLSSQDFTTELPIGYYHISVKGKGIKPHGKSITFSDHQSIDFFLEDADDKFRLFAEVDNTVDTNYDYDLNL